MATVTPTPDLTEFYKYSRPKKPPCKVGIVLGTGSKLNKQARVDLVGALAIDNAIIPSRAIIDWLDARPTGLEFNPNNIASHRKGTCTCAE